MIYDFRSLADEHRYRILTSTVAPRPIAWITSRSPSGLVNTAPFSFFNVMGHAPPVVAVGMVRHPRRGLKDTPRNIAATGEFVINLVPERLIEAMNRTSMDEPADVEEHDCAGLELMPSTQVAPPRLAGSPVSFECIAQTILTTGPDQILVVGRVLAAHVDDDCVVDAERCRIDTPKLGIVSRMHGAGYYCRSTDMFELRRTDRSGDGGEASK